MYYGDNDPGSCPTTLEAIDTDQSMKLLITGLTTSKSKIFSKTEASCFTDTQGFVASFSGNILLWEKFLRSTDHSDATRIVSVPIARYPGVNIADLQER